MQDLKCKQGVRLLTSVAALIFPGAPTWAECVPGSPTVGQTIICEDNGSIVIRVSHTSTLVRAGSNVSEIGVAPPAGFNFTNNIATINVEQGAQVGNIRAQVPFDSAGWARIALTNGGTIAALNGADDAGGRFESLSNLATGVIGPIRGQVNLFANAGLIDGGTQSAYVDAPAPQYYGQGTVGNTGTIRTTSADATIRLYRAFNPNQHVDNVGLIENRGTGYALEGVSILSLTNSATGRIESEGTAIAAPNLVGITNDGLIRGGTTAIRTNGTLQLTNRGTITGDIIASTAGQYQGARIDNRGGTINGNVLLGAGNDVFLADLTTANPLGIITGTLDTGGGIDAIRYEVSTDTVLQSAPTVPAGFEQVQYGIGKNSTLTFAESYASTSQVALGGGDQGFYNPNNRFINRGRIDTAGVALSTDAGPSSGLTIINEGAITASLAGAGDFAVRLTSVGAFTNAGSITGNGGGGVQIGSGNNWTNNGSIIATGMAVQSSQVLNNSGLIRSTGGVGIQLSGHSSTDSMNSGTIEGATVGMQYGGNVLRNSGTIRSAAGRGMEISGGAVHNEAGGIISGGQSAITGGQFIGGARIFNQGTINGHVLLRGASPASATGNVFVAMPGGLLNGDLYLGDGNDLFVTSFVNTGPGAYAGVTGSVTGNGQQSMRYIVDRNVSATIQRGGIFSQTGYELSNGVRLTLDAPAPVDFTLDLAGEGSVDLSADFSGTGDRTLIDMRKTSVLSPPPQGREPTSALDVISRGTISVVQSNSSSYNAGIVTATIGSRFENAGTMTARAATGGQLTAITSSGTVINSGTISLDGATGVAPLISYTADRPTFINTGVIEQIAGGRDARGVVGAGTVINRGTISTGGDAIRFDTNQAESLTNEGTISSANGLAVFGDTYVSASVINKAGGLIAATPGRNAIQFNNRGTIENAGTIIGNVLLGSTSFFSTGTNVYHDRGGTLNGNLTFGDGADILVAYGNQLGITGTIDGGAGIDMFARLYDRSATVDMGGHTLPTSFEAVGFGASGAGTTVTLTGSGRGSIGEIGLFGDGTIINKSTIASGGAGASRVVSFGITRGVPNTALGSSLAFINEGELGDGALGIVRSFTNEGMINAGNRQMALSLGASGGDFLFANEGIIRSNATSTYPYDVYLYPAGDTDLAIVRNSGELQGLMSISMTSRRFQFENSGTLTGRSSSPFNTGGVLISLDSPNSFPAAAQVSEEVSFVNSGSVTGGMTIAARTETLSVANSGTVSKDLSGTALSLQQSPRAYIADQSTDQKVMTFANSGTIDGRVSLFSSAVKATASNSGSIKAMGKAAPSSGVALSLTTYTQQAAEVSLTNTGSILQDQPGGIAVIARSTRSVDGGLGTSTVKVVNSGNILANAGGHVYPVDPFDGGGLVMTPYIPGQNAPADPLSSTAMLLPAIGLVAGGSASTASSLVIENLATGLIAASGPITSSGGTSASAGFEGFGAIAIAGSAETTTITNLGTIRGGAGGVLPVDVRFDFGGTGDFVGGAIHMTGSVDTVINGSTGLVVGAISLGARDDRLENAGRIEGDVHMGTGNDVVVLRSGAQFTGRVQGGEGNDRIEFDMGSAYAAPTEITLNRFEAFETLVNRAGVNAYSGSGAIAQTNVLGGWLIGRAGSSLTGDVSIGAGARFGTAGVVNGNISVAAGGILEPGASPGTMTVNGNVALAGGSTTHIELSRSGASDMLIVNGTLAIASGAALSLTSDAPLLPGRRYDIIAATTITGSFATVTQSATVPGAIRFGPAGVSLLATFALPTGASAQTTGTIGYVNDLILTGRASAALTSAFPTLLANGAADPATFSRISGEAYASASQLGIENGLSLARAMRMPFVATGGEGLFAFGQALGSWRTLDANDTAGTARATSRSGGLLAGIGLRRGNSAIGGFVGYIDGSQSIGALGSRTSADGVVAGLSGQFTDNGFVLGAGIAYDWSKATTWRDLPGGGSANAGHRLRGLVADLSAGYRVALGQGWVVQPGVGFNHVSSRRGSAVEGGSPAFALAVDGRRTQASFLDAQVALRGGQRDGATIEPWLEAGLRRQLAGRTPIAEAGFIGAPRMNGVAGAMRPETSATAAAGLAIRASERMRLHTAYRGEFGSGAGHSVNLGATLIF